MESIDDDSVETEKERQTQNEDPGIFNEIDVQNGNFEHPVMVSISSRNRKGSWSFKRIVDHNTLYLNTRMCIPDAEREGVNEQVVDGKGIQEGLQYAMVTVEPAMNTAERYPSFPLSSKRHHPPLQDPIVTSPDASAQSPAFEFPLLKSGPAGQIQDQNEIFNERI